MAQNTRRLRSILRSAKAKAESDGMSLAAALASYRAQLSDELAGGRSVLSTTNNGHSMTFDGGGSATRAAEDVERLETLLELVTTGDTDTDYAAMLLRLKPANYYRPTFSTLRSSA